MQTCAFDKNHKIIHTKAAIRQQDYYCLECFKIVRLRYGEHRRAHFYHIDPLTYCRQNGKTAQHLELQYYFFNQLPQNDCYLEHRFNSINRIADVVWISQKIIFEIQCSPITGEEVKQRIRDYQSLGYTVIFIFHDKQFNRLCLTAAEAALKQSLYYYSNFDANGNGTIYDQLSFDIGAKRLARSQSFPIDIRYIYINHEKTHPEQKFIEKSNWNLCLKWDRYQNCYFKGDVFDHILHEDTQAIKDQIRQWETQFMPKKIHPHKTLWQKILKPYQVFFRLILERVCN